MNPVEKTVVTRPARKPSLPVTSFERAEETFDSARDVVCFSHLRWDFVYQRPQHLMSRFAREGRVFFVEEPTFGVQAPDLSMRVDKSGVCVVVPRLPDGLDGESVRSLQSRLLRKMFSDCSIRNCTSWYYTPMAWSFTSELSCGVVVYDCMDELSLFRGAPRELVEHEMRLMQAADVVFTGGVSLYETKRLLHSNVHAFPSSIDVNHFMKARLSTKDPADQAGISRPRLGFAGVIDERMDTDLLAAVAATHPEWQIVLLGPVVKIDPASLPRHPNIHYLGQKAYDDLPVYLAGWDVALMPFARNDSTRYISPTKTPEYLASGKPVVSTSIRDVVQTYKTRNLVRFGDTPEEFAMGIHESLKEIADKKRLQEWQHRADLFIANTSWDQTWASMWELVEKAIVKRVTAHATAS